MTAGENPYAPPQTFESAIPDAPRPFGWEMAGKVVTVQQTSRFPMIDPFTGRSEDSMMLQKVRIRHRPRWLLAFPILGAVVLVTLESGGGWAELVLLILPGWLLGWLVSLLVGMFFPICTLRLFFEKRTLRIRKIGERIMAALFLTGWFGGPILSGAPRWMQWIPAVALGGWIIGLVAGLLLNRRLRCHRKDGGRFEIRGFHPCALAALAESQEARHAGTVTPQGSPTERGIRGDQ